MKKIIVFIISFSMIVSLQAAQCAAITKNGNVCKRKATNGAYCWQHGGSSSSIYDNSFDNSVQGDVTATNRSELKDNLVLIYDKENLLGEGFIASVDGKTWLLSTEKIVRYTEKLKCITGNKYEFDVTNTVIEVARNRDLVRIELPNSSSALDIEMDDLSSSKSVTVCSLGVVVTGIVQKDYAWIRKIEASRFKLDASFGEEKNGCPIITNGKVLGVAKSVTTYAKASSFTVQGGVLLGMQTDKIGVRLDGVQWEAVEWHEYLMSSRKLAILNDVARGIGANSISKKDKAYILSKNASAKVKSCVSKIISQDAKYEKAKKELETLKRKQETLKSGSIGRPNDKRIAAAKKKIFDLNIARFEARKQTIGELESTLEKMRMPAKRLKLERDNTKLIFSDLSAICDEVKKEKGFYDSLNVRHSPWDYRKVSF